MNNKIIKFKIKTLIKFTLIFNSQKLKTIALNKKISSISDVINFFRNSFLLKNKRSHYIINFKNSRIN